MRVFNQSKCVKCHDQISAEECDKAENLTGAALFVDRLATNELHAASRHACKLYN